MGVTIDREIIAEVAKELEIDAKKAESLYRAIRMRHDDPFIPEFCSPCEFYLKPTIKIKIGLLGTNGGPDGGLQKELRIEVNDNEQVSQHTIILDL